MQRATDEGALLCDGITTWARARAQASDTTHDVFAERLPDTGDDIRKSEKG